MMRRFGWRRLAAAYRVLVATQTLAWAAITLTKVILRQPRALLPGPPSAIVLTIGAFVAAAAGLLAYFRRGTRPRREAIVRTWTWLQLAGVLTLIGYATTAAAMCFLGGMVTLVVMHLFSPNRFGATGPTELER